MYVEYTEYDRFACNRISILIFSLSLSLCNFISYVYLIMILKHGKVDEYGQTYQYVYAAWQCKCDVEESALFHPYACITVDGVCTWIDAQRYSDNGEWHTIC